MLSRFRKMIGYELLIVSLVIVLRITQFDPLENGELYVCRYSPLPEGSSRFLLLEPGAEPDIQSIASTTLYYAMSGYNETARFFSSCARLYPNFVLLPTNPGHTKEKEAEIARGQWFERIEGGRGCWMAPGKEISGL